MIDNFLKSPCYFFNRIHMLIISLFVVFFVQGLISFIEVEKIINRSDIPVAITGNLHKLMFANIIIGAIIIFLGIAVYVTLWVFERRRRLKIKNKLDDKISKFNISTLIKESVFR